MGRIAVQGLALVENGGERAARIRRGEERPRGVVTGSPPQVLGPRTKVPDRAGAPHPAAIVLGEDHAPAGGDDAIIATRELGQQARLAPAEALLAFDFEDRGDWHAGALDEDAIGIDEFAPQALRERLADRRLAGAHHADEKDVASAHVGVFMAGASRIAKKSPGGPGLEDLELARRSTHRERVLHDLRRDED